MPEPVPGLRRTCRSCGKSRLDCEFFLLQPIKKTLKPLKNCVHCYDRRKADPAKLSKRMAKTRAIRRTKNSQKRERRRIAEQLHQGV